MFKRSFRTTVFCSSLNLVRTYLVEERHLKEDTTLCAYSTCQSDGVAFKCPIQVFCWLISKCRPLGYGMPTHTFHPFKDKTWNSVEKKKKSMVWPCLILYLQMMELSCGVSSFLSAWQFLRHRPENSLSHHSIL